MTFVAATQQGTLWTPGFRASMKVSVPDHTRGFREAAYVSAQSAISLLREPIREPLATIGRITESRCVCSACCSSARPCSLYADE